jgi:hypothetical protein
MSEEKKHFISIWFFIGALLSVYGVLILGAGVWEIIEPPRQQVVLGNLHAAVWWGALLIALGAVYLVKFRPGKG